MIFGNLAGLISGTEQVIFDYEVAGGGVASIATGNILDGNTDGFYTVIARLYGGGGAGESRLSFNGDTGINYGVMAIKALSATISNSAATGETGIKCAGGGYLGAGQVSFSVSQVYAKSGTVRIVNTFCLEEATGTTVNDIKAQGGVWNNTTDNIISMVFNTSGTYGNGSRIIILKSNGFSNGMPTGEITTPYIKGAFVRVGSSTLAATASSITFSGINGDTDVLYLLKFNGKTASAAAQYAKITYNGDAGANYGVELLISAATSNTSIRETADTFLYGNASTTAQNSYFSAIHLIYAKSGFPRTSLCESVTGISGTTVTELDLFGGIWSNTGSSITTINIVSTQTGGFGIGSQFDLYALRPNG